MVVSPIFGQWIQIWLRARMLWHSTSNFSGYISDFCRLLSRLESDCPLKCHNRALYAYVITVPRFVNQCLILLLTGYIALSVMCNHILILCQPKAAWSATTWSTQINEDWRDISITPALCMSHSYNHCLDTLCTKSLNAVTRCSILELTDTVAVYPTHTSLENLCVPKCNNWH